MGARVGTGAPGGTGYMNPYSPSNVQTTISLFSPPYNLPPTTSTPSRRQQYTQAMYDSPGKSNGAIRRKYLQDQGNFR